MLRVDCVPRCRRMLLIVSTVVPHSCSLVLGYGYLNMATQAQSNTGRRSAPSSAGGQYNKILEVVQI